MTYKFTGQMNCDKCRFHAGCIIGELYCPYLAGWEDGQAKIKQWMEERCEDHPAIVGFGPGVLRRDCRHCQKELRQTAPVSPKGDC
jgi:hypothetical protein